MSAGWSKHWTSRTGRCSVSSCRSSYAKGRSSNGLDCSDRVDDFDSSDVFVFGFSASDESVDVSVFDFDFFEADFDRSFGLVRPTTRTRGAETLAAGGPSTSPKPSKVRCASGGTPSPVRATGASTLTSIASVASARRVPLPARKLRARISTTATAVPSAHSRAFVLSTPPRVKTRGGDKIKRVLYSPVALRLAKRLAPYDLRLCSEEPHVLTSYFLCDTSTGVRSSPVEYRKHHFVTTFMQGC